MGEMRRQVIHRQMMDFVIALPAGAPFFQPYVAAGHIAFFNGHPAFEAEAGAFQGDIVLHPASQPRFDVDIIRLQPDPAFIQQAILIAKIHPHLHDAMLAGEAGKAELPLGAVTVPAVQPGQLRDRQLRPLTGNSQEAQMAVAQSKVVELT